MKPFKKMIDTTKSYVDDPRPRGTLNNEIAYNTIIELDEYRIKEIITEAYESRGTVVDVTLYQGCECCDEIRASVYVKSRNIS